MSLESRVHNSFALCLFFLVSSPGPYICDNPFRNEIFSKQSCQTVLDEGLYLVSEDVFLWSYMFIYIVTVDPSESNPICFYDYSLDDSTCYILFFLIFKSTKGLFFIWTLGCLFLAFQLGLYAFLKTSWLCTFIWKNQLLATSAI